LASSDSQAELDRVRDAIQDCDACGLGRSAIRHVPGEGPAEARIMCLGEAPGAEEDRQGRPFVGPSGQLLTRLLGIAGIDRGNVFITSVVKCHPPGNREPTPAEMAVCMEHTRAQIAVIRPKVICTLGRIAAQALIDKSLSITREHGRARRVDGLLYLPLYHPAAALHQQQLLTILEADMLRLKTILAEELSEPA